MSETLRGDVLQRIQALPGVELRKVHTRKNTAQKFARRIRRKLCGRSAQDEKDSPTLADIGVDLEIAHFEAAAPVVGQRKFRRTVTLDEEDALALYAWVARQNRCRRS
jgi:hypothetical protein